MARFTEKRQMTLILALVACLMATPYFAVPARAGGATSEGEPGGGSDVPTKGDPDVPVGPARTVRSGAQRTGTVTVESRVAGDGSVSQSTWMWRLRVVLMGLKAYYLRF
jgi:hypothetical protein